MTLTLAHTAPLAHTTPAEANEQFGELIFLNRADNLQRGAGVSPLGRSAS